MKVVVALFFLLISVVSFASNPDEILQTPSAFEEDRRKAEAIPAPQGLLPNEASEDSLIEAGEDRYRSQHDDRSRERLEDQKQALMEREHGEPKFSPPPHVQGHRRLQVPPQTGPANTYRSPLTAE